MAESDPHVAAILESYFTLSGSMEHINSYHLPNRDEVGGILDHCRELIYPGYVNRTLIRATGTELQEHVREIVEVLRIKLRRQLYRGLHHKAQMERGTAELDCPSCAEKAEGIVEDFFGELVSIRAALADDVEAHYEGDPAATGPDEVIFCYPGLHAITVYRIAHSLHLLGARLIPRMMSSLAHEMVGIDIHPGASIGASFLIDHGTGVVIGETTVIGDRVRLYQGVTLGALSVKERTESGVKRHPTLEDDVVIYAGATILGGATIIGKGAVIGGNSWVTKSVAAGATFSSKPPAK
ncbi:MAG: serine acetyltransferase [Myxococcales bacterium]|nr:serine acetyltransferase [Myxococcales bacterium]